MSKSLSLCDEVPTLGNRIQWSMNHLSHCALNSNISHIDHIIFYESTDVLYSCPECGINTVFQNTFLQKWDIYFYQGLHLTYQ